MSTLDEITKEKQRIAEALARAEAQREKLTGQLGELEAAERVLARYSKGTPAGKPLQPRRRSRRRRPLLHRDQDARALGPNNQLAASAPHRPLVIRCLLWHRATRS